jgi:hypothetical protein
LGNKNKSSGVLVVRVFKNTDYRAFLNLIGIVTIGFLLSACAIGNKYDYQGQPIEIQASSDDKIGVVVVDQRSYVVSGEKSIDFVGTQRGGFGQPFDVVTNSGNAMADAFANAITNGLKSKGIDASAIYIEPTSKRSDAKKQALSQDYSKFLFVFLGEWKTDTLVNVKFIYDVSADVIDKDGSVLASYELTNTENLGGDVVSPVYYATDNVPIAFKRVMEKLLGEPGILTSLK